MTDNITLPRDVGERLYDLLLDRIDGVYHASSEDIALRDALDAALAEPEKVTVPMQYGWLCPACGRGNAPLAQTCPCKGYGAVRVGYGNAYMIGGT